MNVYYDYDIESVFNWVKEHFILKHSASLVNSPWYDYDIEIDLRLVKEGANKQVISSQADSLIKISRIWADFFPANTSNQPI